LFVVCCLLFVVDVGGGGGVLVLLVLLFFPNRLGSVCMNQVVGLVFENENNKIMTI
jgi:hypothetical protein